MKRNNIEYSWKTSKFKFWPLLPIAFVLGFIPLIMRVYEYENGLGDMDWFPNSSTTQVDVFLAWKSFIIMVFGAIMVGILIVKLYRDYRLPAEKMHLFMWIFGLCVLLSGIFSMNRSFSFGGSFERFEPVFVIISYLVFCWYGFVYSNNEENVKFILTAAAVGMAILLLIGIFQGFGLDLYKTDFGKALITTRLFRKANGELTVTMAVGQAYSTLYNPDFSSLYVSTLFPVALGLTFAAKKWWTRLIYGLLTVAFVVELYMARVSSGFLGILGGAVIVVFLLLFRKKKAFLIGLIAFAAIVIIGIFAFGNRILERIGWDWERENYTTTYAEDDTEFQNPIVTEKQIENIETLDDAVVFTLKDGRQISITWEFGTDGVYPQVSDPELFDSLGGSFALGEFTADTYFLQININAQSWNFIKQSDGYYYLNGAGKVVKIHQVPYAKVFPAYMMSGRGDIWNHTIPVLGHSMLLGSGADTYILAYPQDDYIRSRDDTTYDVKPHSFYLQQWVEHGFIGFAAIMIFFFWYVISSFKLYKKAKLKDPMTKLGIGCFGGVVCTMITFLANDSNTCTSCVFWGVLGIGLGINHYLRKQTK